MNTYVHSIPSPVNATVIDALIGLLEDKDGILGHADSARHLSRCLQMDLDFSFKRERAIKKAEYSLTFMFDSESIETTEWLMSELWLSATKTNQKIQALCDALYELREQVLGNTNG